MWDSGFIESGEEFLRKIVVLFNDECVSSVLIILEFNFFLSEFLLIMKGLGREG